MQRISSGCLYSPSSAKLGIFPSMLLFGTSNYQVTILHTRHFVFTSLFYTSKTANSAEQCNVVVVFTPFLRFKNKEDSLPNKESLHVDFLAGFLSKLHI